MFAVAHFAQCEAHIEHAAAVHRALEDLLQGTLSSLDPDRTVGDTLPSGAASAPSVDSLDAIEVELAHEEELSRPALVKKAVRLHLDTLVLNRLLGPAATSSTWDSRTIRLRSIRGVINERVRHDSRGCTCAEKSEPSNNQMQRTALGPTGRRR
jgi:hypothetical protein